MDDETPEHDFQQENFVALGHDWAAGPYFWDEEGCAVELGTLPISAPLCERYARWFYWYENRHCPGYEPPGFDRENPPFPDLKEFAAEGRAIAEAIKGELPDWRVVYTDYLTRESVEL